VTLEKGIVPAQNEGAAGAYVPGVNAASPSWPGNITDVTSGTALGSRLPAVELFRFETGGLYSPSTVYKFGGWNTKADGSGETYTASTPITGNVTLYAQWIQIECTVTLEEGSVPEDVASYDSGNHWISESHTVFDERQPYILPKEFTVDNGTVPGSKLPVLHIWVKDAPTSTYWPVYSNYSVTGWNTKADGSGETYTASTPITKDVTLYAQWGLMYIVTLEDNVPAGSGAWTGYLYNADDTYPTSWTTRSVTVPENTGLGDKLPDIFLCTGTHADPQPAGYKLTGWNTAADGTGTEYTASTPITKDVTLYAQWVRQ